MSAGALRVYALSTLGVPRRRRLIIYRARHTLCGGKPAYGSLPYTVLCTGWCIIRLLVRFGSTVLY